MMAILRLDIGAKLGVLLWFLAYMWALIMCAGAFETGWRVFIALGLMPIGLIVTTFIHEAGHAVAARMVGWRVIVFSVHWLSLQIPNRNWVVSPKTKRGDAVGWVSSVPSALRFSVPWRQAAFSAGGPLASLLQFAILFGAAAGSAFPSVDVAVRADLLAGSLGVLGLGTFLGTAIPDRANGGNDGARFIAEMQNKSGGEPIDPAIWLSTLLTFNVRLKDLPKWMIDEVAATKTASQDCARFVDVLEIGRTLDAAPVDVRRARSLIDAFWRDYEPNDWLRACDGFLAAAHERDLPRAEAMAGDIAIPSDLPQMVCAAKAATDMLGGRRDSALAWLDRMDAFVAESSPYRDLTYRDIRKRVEAIEPFEPRTLATVSQVSH